MQRIPSSLSPHLGVDLAFDLGWDHAHYGVAPEADTLLTWPQLAQGFAAGRQTYGVRTLQATHHARTWLRLRLHALEHGLVLDTEQLTPRLLQLIDVAHCPITREALTRQSGAPSDATVVRVLKDAAYAAGNLAVFSQRASQAQAVLAPELALASLREASGEQAESTDGLARTAQARLAVMSSYVRRLDHAVAATLPMLVLPPNRLRVFNPIQALQAVVCRLVLAQSEDLTARLQALRAHLPGKALQQDMAAFTQTYVAQVQALCQARQGHPTQPGLRWAVEDAWLDRVVLNRWKHLARQLNAEQAEAIVQAQGQGMRSLPDHQATEGWALATRGLLSPRPVPRGVPHALHLPRPARALPPAWLAARQTELFAARA